MHRSQPEDVVLITSAVESNDDEYDRRRRKYAVMMSIRAACVLGAALTYRISIWLALAMIVGGIVLPWCAVLIANDRPPKRKSARVEFHPGLYRERALPAGDDGRTVDG